MVLREYPNCPLSPRRLCRNVILRRQPKNLYIIDSVEIIRFFTSFRMTITAFLPITTQSLVGEGGGEGEIAAISYVN
jgi:hypothetical protein